ncbi:DUF4367 domain-containing protein [Desulfitobacterium sp.]|uniref:DUF4367 domain-containing protein n=1 Tax=Desulfitobacterium sp. TaxID=49981 RepID=UPI002B21498D|nr:DUF4367 domain-containing protein [Desulfitobacterium sp.]MEA4900877.1 DUF4367 domain-containing protein [Desulfitobacterium sp.]
MVIYDEPIENVIRDQIEKEASNINVPSFESQWEKIKNELQEDTHKEKHLNIKWIACAAIFITAVGFFSLNQAKDVNAFGVKIFSFFNHMVGKTTVNKTDTYRNPSSSQGVPAVQDLGSNSDKEVTLQEAQAAIPSKLAVPNYTPPGSKLNRIVLTDLGNEKSIMMEYVYQDNVIVFTQRSGGIASSRGNLYDTDDTVVKDVMINGTPATLLINKTGLTTMDWQIRGLILQLKGTLDQTEITKIAESIN